MLHKACALARERLPRCPGRFRLLAEHPRAGITIVADFGKSSQAREKKPGLRRKPLSDNGKRKYRDPKTI
jgi:hypothetical protein